MPSTILANLCRQDKALDVLCRLLAEEHDLLRQRRPDEVTGLEFSIHELMRQLAVEREDLTRRLNGARLVDFLDMVEDDMKRAITKVLASIDQKEQAAARHASTNAELVLALMDQSRNMLNFINDKIQPKNTSVYSKKGVYGQARSEARLLKGAL